MSREGRGLCLRWISSMGVMQSCEEGLSGAGGAPFAKPDTQPHGSIGERAAGVQHSAGICAGRKQFSVVKRGLVTFGAIEQWTKQAAARGAGNRRFRPLSALRAHTKPPYKTDSR